MRLVRSARAGGALDFVRSDPPCAGDLAVGRFGDSAACSRWRADARATRRRHTCAGFDRSQCVRTGFLRPFDRALSRARRRALGHHPAGCDRPDVRRAGRWVQASPRCPYRRRVFARGDYASDLLAPRADDRARVHVAANAHGALSDRLLRRREWRLLPAPSRQHDERHRAPALCRNHQSKRERVRRRRPALPGIWATHLSGANRRRCRFLMFAASRSNASDEGRTLRLSTVSL